METKNIFISHIHKDDNKIHELKNLMSRKGYNIRNGSIDDTNPNDASNHHYIKYDLLKPRIEWASSLAVIITPDTHKSWWVNWEIECAASMGKPVIGIWGPDAQESDLPEAFKTHGDALVSWNSDSIANAIEGDHNWSSSEGNQLPPVEIKRIRCQ